MYSDNLTLYDSSTSLATYLYLEESTMLCILINSFDERNFHSLHIYIIHSLVNQNPTTVS